MRLRFAVPTSLLTTLMVAATPGLVTAAPPQGPGPTHNHGLTINATPNPILAGEAVLIYGQLNGDSSGGQPILLYHRVNPSRHFKLVGMTTTTPLGFYAFTGEERVVMSNRSWFVRAAAGTQSPKLHEHVAALVRLEADQTTQNTNHAIVFSGHVSPNHASERVLLQEQRGLTGDDWRTVKSGLLGRGSNYLITYRWRRAGIRDVRVVFPGDDRNVEGVSDTTTVTIQQTQVPDFTISSSSPIVQDNMPVTISGTLYQPGSTTPEPNTSVTLWGRVNREQYREITDVVTHNDGSYAFTEMPLANEAYQVRTTLPPARHSAQLSEGVRDVVTMSALSPNSEVGQTLKFDGTVSPDKAGEVIYLQRLSRDGDWHNVEVRNVQLNSTFEFLWTFGNPGRKEFRARIASDHGNVGGVSSPVTVNVSLPQLSLLPPAS